MYTVLEHVNAVYRYDIMESKEHIFMLKDQHKYSINTTYEIHITASYATLRVIGRVLSSDTAHKKYAIKVYNHGVQNSIHIDIHGICEDRSTMDIELLGALTSTSKASIMRLDAHIKLFDNAICKCLPCLDVHTDDVNNASHGATITSFNTDIYHYLMSRGMNLHIQKELYKNEFIR